MGDPGVGQLQRLREITGGQLAAYPFRAIGVLGVAGGTASTAAANEIFPRPGPSPEAFAW
ncbi:hypothetical protein QF035_002842 [Streptomyces umbrinus]|uniref:Uncharacterized protein n=1 Tax=Streptomyces umbrinus TaxID=67370 RepID=A0ABU0SNW7_9ACTN|nr:hypothetical protein [Streptomyces umbrinus]MDQ1025260.1 hypothetical protein [Streptomyces umbrinus]